MSAQRRGLGRGLDALLGPETPATPGIEQIRIDAIRPNPRQPRTNFDPAALAELERSIRDLGVLVPIIVRPLPNARGTYELVAGERRWRAAAAAHLETIPAIVRAVDDRGSLEVAIVENLQRRDLDPLEEAMGYQHLIDEFGFTQERVAERVAKGRPTVANALRLLGLSDAIKARLRSGALTVGHARALLALDEDVRERIAADIERDGLTVRQVEQLGARRAPRAAREPRPAAVAPSKDADLDAVETRLRYRLGAPVAIVPGPNGGRIEIRFAGGDDLARLVDLLLAEPQ